MIVDVILGSNIDTSLWITDLQANKADLIVVLDYDYYGEPEMRMGILYISTFDIKNFLKTFDTVCFYKSMYVYPGMGDQISSLFKK